nr:MAG TPA: hypothetical protein [Bacteriophage sp.]
MAKKMTFVMFVSVFVFQVLIILSLLLYISLLINTNSNETQANITPPLNLPDNLEIVLDVEDKKPKGLQVVEF